MRRRALQAGLVLGLLCSAPALLQAQQQYGDPGLYGNSYLTWRNTPPDGSSIDVTYYISPLFSPAMKAAILAAAATWNAAGAKIQLVPWDGLTGTPEITINPVNLALPGFLGVTGLTTNGPVGAYPDSTPYYEITSASILINMNPATLWTTYDLYSFMLTQFGLALGLGYANGTDPSSVMNQTLSPGQTYSGPSALDVAALQTLYGAPEPATWGLFGLGLLALGASWRYRRPTRAAP